MVFICLVIYCLQCCRILRGKVCHILLGTLFRFWACSFEDTSNACGLLGREFVGNFWLPLLFHVSLSFHISSGCVEFVFDKLDGALSFFHSGVGLTLVCAPVPLSLVLSGLMCSSANLPDSQKRRSHLVFHCVHSACLQAEPVMAIFFFSFFFCQKVYFISWA